MKKDPEYIKKEIDSEYFESEFVDDNFDDEDYEFEDSKSQTQNKSDYPMGPEDLNLKSEEVNEVLGASPAWLIRSGILMIGIVVALTLLSSYFIKYSDTVSTKINITTKDLPASIIAKQGGKITTMIATEHQEVKKGDHLGVIENNAKYNDILKARNLFSCFMEDFNQNKKVAILTENDQDFELGSLRASFFQLQSSAFKYRLYQDQDVVEKQIEQLQMKVSLQKEIIERLNQKNKIKNKSFALSRKKYKIDKKLYQKKVILEQAFDDASNAYFATELELITLKEEEANQKLRLEELNFQILELINQGNKSILDLEETVKSNALSFENDLKKWEETYLLKAPISGKVNFYKFWTINQEVKSGDEIMVIIPDTHPVFAYSYLPAANSGKVQLGQKVRIELTDFPSEQFGSIYGTIAYKSDIARESKYFLKIELPNGLKTKNGKELKFSQEMSGTAHIVTKELRLLERLTYKYINDFEKFM